MSKELELGRNPDIQVSTELTRLFNRLPLERCEYKTDPTTNKGGWYAPNGFAFRMSGKFMLKCDQSEGDCTVYVPIASSELFTSEPDEWSYQSEGNILGPLEFVGKWLCVDENDKDNSVTVRKDIEPYYEDGAYYLELNGYLLPMIGVAKFSSIEWTQSFATGLSGACDIVLVPYEEMKDELIIPKTKNDENRILLPLGVTVSRDDDKIQD